MKKNKVYLVGAGPGDPGLLTLRAKEVLQQADAVLYDALISPGILNFIPPKAFRVFRGSRGKSGALSQSGINKMLVRLGKKYQRTVRLKGGDPFVFGRGAEEALALRKAGIGFEIVPGVTSAVAAPAYAGVPVTHRDFNSSFTVVTGHEEPVKSRSSVNWENLAQNDGTLVFLMGLKSLPELSLRLIQEGKNPQTPAAAVQWGTTSRQKTVLGTLESLPRLVTAAGLVPPTTVIVGDVVKLAPQLDWLSAKPLFGKRILVTRTRSQASFLSQLLSDRGAEVVEIPTIEIKPLRLDGAARKKAVSLGEQDWVVFFSANAVEILMENLSKLGLSSKIFKTTKIACVGESTAKALKPYGLSAKLVPKDYKQEGLIRAFKTKNLQGQKILLARAKEGRTLLADFLRKRKALLEEWALYENRVPPGTKERIKVLFEKEGGVDLLVFASSSSVDHFYGLLNPTQIKKWTKRLATAAIGPVTGKSIQKWIGRKPVEPRVYTMEALVDAIEAWAGKRQKN